MIDVRRIWSKWPVLFPASVTAVLLGLIIFPFPLSRPFTGDAAIYHYGGLLLTEGYAPYLHLYDFKPPFIYLTTGIIAILAPGDGMLQVYIGQIIAGVFSTLTVAGTAGVVLESTGNRRAAFGAGIATLAFPYYFFLTSTGIRAAHGAVAAAILAFWAMEAGRFRSATALATVAAGYWPIAVITPAVVFVEARRESLRLLPLVGILAGVTLFGVLPIAARGALFPMVNEVLFGPLIKGEAGGPLAHVRELRSLGAQTTVLWILGGFGSAAYLDQIRVERRLVSHWWIPVVGAFVVVWALFVDLDGPVDLFYLNAIAAVGLGITVSQLTRRQQTALILAIVAVVFLTWDPHRGWALNERSGAPGDTAYHDHLINQQVPPESCHMRIGFGEREWMNRTGETNQTLECGRTLPFG